MSFCPFRRQSPPPIGKSRIIQSIGRQACVLGYRVRYVTSAKLFEDLTGALADQTLPKRVRYYTRFDLLIIDEFGFDRTEREQSRHAASLIYKVIDARGPSPLHCHGQPWSPTSISTAGPNTLPIHPWPWPSLTASSTAPSS